MEDNAGVGFAVIRLRTEEESTQLRLLLQRHGYDEPSWINSNGRTVSPPSMDLPPAEDRGKQVAADVDRTQAGFPNRSFLTLPMVLNHSQDWHPARLVGTSCVSLPLASASSLGLGEQDEASNSSTRTPRVNEDNADLSPADTPGASELGETSETGLESWVSQTPLRARGKKPNPPENPNLYYTCQLCKNKILGTRVSNLQNHVRRHATIKQFACRHCDYRHNEIAKVRLHMTSNHKDPESQPVNNLSTDMQAVWRALFSECFPTRAQRRWSYYKDARMHQPIWYDDIRCTSD